VIYTESYTRQEDVCTVESENTIQEETEEKVTLPTASEWGSITAASKWGSSSSSEVRTPTWGNVREQNGQTSNTKEANYWLERARVSERPKEVKQLKGEAHHPLNLKKTICFPKVTPDPEEGQSTSRKEEADNWGWGNEVTDEKEETLSGMFDEIGHGRFDVSKKRKRFKNKVKCDGRVIMENSNEESDSDESSRSVDKDSRPRPN
jgi:hypothetical protein